MARLRRTNFVNVLVFEEKTRLTNFFMLLVEIDLRSPKTTKAKARKRALRSFSEVGRTNAKIKHRPIKQEPCSIKCPAMCNPSRSAQRDLFLNVFTRILGCNKSNFIMRYNNDRHHSFIANS